MSRLRPPDPPRAPPPPRMPPPRSAAPRPPRPAAAPRPPAVRAPTSRMQDRPGRLRLIWKRQRRPLLRALAAGLLLAAGLAGYSAVQKLGRGNNFAERLAEMTAQLGLRVNRVEVEGLQKTPEPLLWAALAVHTGDPILAFSLADARSRIETINWVRSATVSRRLPGTIVVQLTERRPFAVWQNQGRFVLIDRDGQTVTDSDVAAFARQVPLVVGAGAPAAAAALLDALAAYPLILGRMQAAVRVGERRWNLRLTNGADVLLPEGAEAAALARLMELQTAHALLDRPLQVVDLRLPDRLVVRAQADKPDGKDGTGKGDTGRGEAARSGRKPT